MADNTGNGADRSECHCVCHQPGLVRATVEDVRYLLNQLSGVVGELEIIVGKRFPHPRREEDK